MSEYYTVLFIAFAFLQDEIKGVFSSLICFFMIYAYNPFESFLLSIGYEFFIIALLFDCIFLVISLFIIGSRTGNALFIVMCLSVVVNLVGYIIPDGSLYSHYKDSYRFVNILLFEVMLYICFTSTILYPWIVTKLKRLKS